MNTINMQTMRYLNLLDKIANVKTSICFEYNNHIIFAVQKNQIYKAVGPSARNIKMLQEKTGKKIKIIKKIEDNSEIKEFITDVVSPIKFKDLEINEKILTITAGSTQNKASLIGRNKRRLDELKKITQNILNLDLKIV
jgi:N utilization substance protein A